MQLTELKAILGEQAHGILGDAWFMGACLDSKQIQPGMLFVACVGARTDGNLFIPQALEKGAAAVLTEQKNNSQA